jgi:hypothetical protein
MAAMIRLAKNRIDLVLDGETETLSLQPEKSFSTKPLNDMLATQKTEHA